MEEVDNIIIDSLRNINCQIDEDISSLKSFTENTIVAAIVSCLEIIIPGLNLSKKMPNSMSTRLKYASLLVEHIKSLGFHGDIGYQSILYSNEIEIRKVLMFLIERLPRESSKVAVAETIGFVPTLVKEIEDKVKFALNQSWIPHGLLVEGSRIIGNKYLKHSYADSTPLLSEHLNIPHMRNATEEFKDYWVHNLPDISKQTTCNKLIPSLLYDGKDIDLTDPKLREFVQLQKEQVNVTTMNDISMLTIPLTVSEVAQTMTESNEIDTEIATILRAIDCQKQSYEQLKDELKASVVQLSQQRELKEQVDVLLKESLNQLKIKSRTLTVLSKEENMSKLKSLVENGNDRLLNLANQWNEVQTPLIEQYRTLQTSVSQQELKLHEEQERLRTITEKVQQLEIEYNTKEQLERKLLDECSKINNSNNRASYTKRILEIIGNIKKQDLDIAKILKDTKSVQKEINTLTGQLDRSFTLSDALIFKDAKLDETARKSYKLLATLHMDCETIVQAITDVGLIERECRNIQDQIDAELNKDIATKLQRVLGDIEELHREANKT